MVILNKTRDSFSDGCVYHTVDEALYRVEQMISEGMDVLDIGGESTRPGYTQVSDEEEIGRVIPMVEKIKSRFDTVISLDTYKSKVAAAGIAVGVDIINYICVLKYYSGMAVVVAQAKAACCLMHNRKEAVYENYMNEVLRDLGATIDIAHAAGISDDRIILDPGVGFGKSYEQNLEVIDRLESLHSLGYPLLLGASRKSVVGLALEQPVQQRLEGTIVTTVYAVQKGAMFVRVHDVKENVRAIRMTEAIRDGYRI